MTLTSVKQRHIENDNIDIFFFGNDTPLLQYFIIISSQSVNALDIEAVARLYFSQHTLIVGTVEVLSGLFIHVNIFIRYADLSHCYTLPVFMLIFAGYTNVSVDLICH